MFGKKKKSNSKDGCKCTTKSETKSQEKSCHNTKASDMTKLVDELSFYTKIDTNNIGNKYLTPNKKTKIVIKNKKIYIDAITTNIFSIVISCHIVFSL